MNHRSLKLCAAVIALPCFSILSAIGGRVGAQMSIEPGARAWRTHVLASGSELRLPAPPSAAASPTELAELRTLASQRTAAALDQINYWDAGSPGYRWS